MRRLTLLIAASATAAAAEPRSITEIYFSGPGIVTASEGYRPPAVGVGNKIRGHIRFYALNCLPANITGTVNLGNWQNGNNLCDNVWQVEDRFLSIDDSSQWPTALLTFADGDLVGVEFDGTYGPHRFGIDTSNFAGMESYWQPRDYSYRGTWELTDVRIAYDGEPLPGTVPETSTWAMLIAGFGITGALMRRRRTRRVAA